jgi:ribonuclease P protein component
VETLRSSSEIDALFAEGRRGATRLVTVLASPTPEGRDPSGRVVFIAGKRLGGAVLRNRSKRILRECVRRRGGPWPGRDIAVIAHVDTGTAPPEQLDEALDRALRSAGVRA